MENPDFCKADVVFKPDNGDDDYTRTLDFRGSFDSAALHIRLFRELGAFTVVGINDDGQLELRIEHQLGVFRRGPLDSPLPDENRHGRFAAAAMTQEIGYKLSDPVLLDAFLVWRRDAKVREKSLAQFLTFDA